MSRAERLGAVAAVVVAAFATGAARATPDVRPPSRDGAWVARLVSRVVALSGPGRGRVVRRESPFAPANGGPVSLLVFGSRIGVHGRLWLRVLLPVRPNGIVGWIRAAVGDSPSTVLAVKRGPTPEMLTAVEVGKAEVAAAERNVAKLQRVRLQAGRPGHGDVLQVRLMEINPDKRSGAWRRSADA